MRDILVYFKAYIINNSLKLIWVIFFATISFGIVWRLMQRQANKLISNKITSLICGMLFSINSSFIFVMTLFDRKVMTGRKFDFGLCTSYIRIFIEDNPELILQAIMNVIMFIPIGFLMPFCFGFCQRYRYVMLITFISSLMIEFIQGIFQIGYFEMNDVVNNNIGTLIGIMFQRLYIWLKTKIRGASMSGNNIHENDSWTKRTRRQE